MWKVLSSDSIESSLTLGNVYFLHLQSLSLSVFLVKISGSFTPETSWMEGAVHFSNSRETELREVDGEIQAEDDNWHRQLIYL